MTSQMLAEKQGVAINQSRSLIIKDAAAARHDIVIQAAQTTNPHQATENNVIASCRSQEADLEVAVVAADAVSEQREVGLVRKR